MTVNNTETQDHGLRECIDFQILKDSHRALYRKEQMTSELPNHQYDRSVGAIVSNEISKIYGHLGLPEDTLNYQLYWICRTEFGCFWCTRFDIYCGRKYERLFRVKVCLERKLIVKKPATLIFSC